MGIWDSIQQGLLKNMQTEPSGEQLMKWNRERLQDVGVEAHNRYLDLTNPNSNFNQGLLGMYQQLTRSAAPTQDTMFSMNRGSGMSSGSASALAIEQSKAAQSRATDAGTTAWMKHVFNQEDNARGYLGQRIGAEQAALDSLLKKYGIDKQFELGKYQIDEESESSLVDSLLGLGGGLLMFA